MFNIAMHAGTVEYIKAYAYMFIVIFTDANTDTELLTDRGRDAYRDWRIHRGIFYIIDIKHEYMHNSQHIIHIRGAV